MKTALIGLVAVVLGLIASPHSVAGTIPYYDSVNGGTADTLDRLDGQTDNSFVDLSSPTTTLGSNAVFVSQHASQSAVQGLGDGLDKQFRFGSSAGGSGTMSGTLSVAHMANGPYIEVSFTAAQAMILSELSFKLFNNSNNGSNYGARDAGLFVKTSSESFSQFGNLFTTPTSNGNQGTVTFNDTLVAFYQDSYDNHLSSLRDGGICFYDSDQVKELNTDRDVIHIGVPFTSAAIEAIGGSAKDRGKNIFVLGMICAVYKLDRDCITEIITRKFGKKNEDILRNAMLASMR